MKIEVSRDECIGAGVCAAAAPAVFDQDETEGYVLVLDSEPDESEHAAVRAAAAGCPGRVISIR